MNPQVKGNMKDEAIQKYRDIISDSEKVIAAIQAGDERARLMAMEVTQMAFDAESMACIACPKTGPLSEQDRKWINEAWDKYKAGAA